MEIRYDKAAVKFLQELPQKSSGIRNNIISCICREKGLY